MTDPSFVVDACTLNNALNAMQIALLVALLKWVRPPAGHDSDRQR